MIELILAWDAVFNAVTSVAMIAFGFWVLSVAPWTRSTKMLALFSVAYGILYVLDNLWVWTGADLFYVYNPVRGPLYVAAAVGLLGLAHGVLQPLGERARPFWRTVLAVTVGMAFVPLALTVAFGFPALETGPVPRGLAIASTLTFRIPYHLYLSAFFALPLVLAWQYRHPPAGREEAARTQAVLITTALVLWPALYAGSRFTWLADPTVPVNNFPIHAALLVAGFVGLAGLWLSNARAHPDRGRHARAMALLILGVVLLGMVNDVLLNPTVWPRDGPFWGIARLLSVVVLGYAILQHQVLGMDAKIRWGVSRTAVAAVFVLVFFVVGEGGEALLESFLGPAFGGGDTGTIIGIAAAGVLALALRPVQGFAERVARAAMPGALPDEDAPDDERLQLYREQLRIAWADGEPKAKDRRFLANLRERLGLSKEEARAVEDEVAGT